MAAKQKAGRQGITRVAADVEDPEAKPPRRGSPRRPRTIRVEVNIRESSIAQMFARDQIDEAQMRAADRFRALYERAGLSGIRSPDITRDRVDESRVPDAVPPGRLDAARELGRLAGELGKVGYPVCVLVCGDRLSVRQTAERFLGRPAKKRELDYYGRLLRDHLDLLCRHWGYKSGQGR